jgi:acyl carrier protein
MNWTDFISTELRNEDSSVTYGFNSPAPASLIAELKEAFGLEVLPTELEELYRQTNGIDELMNGDKIGDLIWPISKVIETNMSYRTDPENKNIYMSFDQLLFVADSGTGSLFGYIVINGRAASQSIYVWNPIEDSRTWIAADLGSFIEGWVTGKITI